MTNYVSEVLVIIKNHFNAILNGTQWSDWSEHGGETARQAHIAYYRPYKDHIYITSEQEFTRLTDLSPKSIYVTVKFGQSSIDFGQVIVPITVNAVSEENGLAVCQKLLFDFAETYTQNVDPDTNDFVKEIWYTPSIVSNFNDIYSGYRSLMYMTGNFIIGKDSNQLEYLHYYPNIAQSSYINIDAITFSTKFTVQPDTQAFYVSNGITQSVAKVGSYTMNVTCFKIDNAFFDKIFAIQYGDMQSEPSGIATRFDFKLKYKKDASERTVSLLMYDVSMQQNKGDLPIVSLTFMR